MKKILLILILVALNVTRSNASELYLASSVLISEIGYQYNEGSRGVSLAQVDKKNISSDSVDWGFESGYRGSIGPFFVGPEIYFYHYRASADDFKNVNNPTLSDQDKLRLEAAYGLGLTMGIEFSHQFATFVRYGTGRAEIKTTWYNDDNTKVITRQSSEVADLVSFGAWYYLNEVVALRASYDTLRFDTDAYYGAIIQGNSTSEGYSSSFKAEVNSLNLGLIFRFSL
jgi:hypothetical protein